MEMNKLKQYLSLLLCLLISLNPGFAAFAQDFSLKVPNLSPTGDVVRPVNPDAIGNFTSRIASEDYDRIWQMTGPFGGDISVLTIDPRNADRIWIGSGDGQIFRSTDGGTIWKRLRPGLNAIGFIVKVIHFDREQANVVYAGVKPQTELGEDSDSGGLFISENDGESWREVPALRGRAVRSFSQSASDPNVLAIAASNGVYRSTDRGKSWKQITPVGDPELRGFHSVAIDPRDAGAIYVGTHHLPWKTLDAGATWKRTGFKEAGMIDDSDIFTIHIDPDNPNTVMMSACSGIYRSQDAGTAWTKFQGIPYSSRRTHVIYRHPTRAQTIFAGTTEGLWISTADGKPDSWRQVTSAQLVINAIAVHPSQPDRVYLGTQDNGVVISLDGGETYEASNAGFVNRQVPTVLADSKERGRIYAGVIFDGVNGGLFVSEDGGISWRQSMNGMGVRDVYSLFQSPARPETIYAGTNHGLFRSDDHGRNWAPVKREEHVEPAQEKTGKPRDAKTTSNEKPASPAPASAPTGIRPRVVTPSPATKQVESVVQRSVKKAPAKSAQNSKAAAAKPAGRKPAQIVGQSARGKTVRKSKKKIEPPKPPPSDRVELQNQVLAIIPFTARIEKMAVSPENNGEPTPEPLNPNWLIASTWNGYFFTDDEKKGWKPFKLRLTDDNESAAQPTINVIAASPHAPGVLYIGTNDGLFVSRDNGVSFQLTKVDEDVKRIRSIVFDPRTAETIYIGTSGGLFRSMNGGKSWDHVGGGMPQATNVGGLIVSSANPDEIYLYDEIRVAIFHSKDRGKNWGRMDISQLPSLKMRVMISDPFDSNKLYAGSFSGGVYVMSRK